MYELHVRHILTYTSRHVAHGKSTLVRNITGTSTMWHKAEMARNMTIMLGHAAGELYKCSYDYCPRPGCYASSGCGGSLQGKQCNRDGCIGHYDLVRKISFVDCPGHEILMRTMIAGTSVMNAAPLVISAEEKCPQPQTVEDLAAIEALGLKNVIIAQNKIECVGEEAASKHARQVRRFLNGTVAEDAPIVPISARMASTSMLFSI
jgi:translation initiation factor 2 subunit 3